MQQGPAQLIADFVEEILKIRVGIEDVRHETLAPPHESLQLPKGSCAVYVFTLASDPAICLKVGKVGAKSAARFVSQHYIPTSSKSNLAKSLLTAKQQWQRLGIAELDESSVGEWIQANTIRNHFFVADPLVAHILEAFLQRKLSPLFEG